MKQTIIGALAALTLAAPAAYLPTAFADPAPIAPRVCRSCFLQLPALEEGDFCDECK